MMYLISRVLYLLGLEVWVRGLEVGGFLELSSTIWELSRSIIFGSRQIKSSPRNLNSNTYRCEASGVTSPVNPVCLTRYEYLV